MDAVLARVQPKHLQRTYELKGYNNSTEFLELLARKTGRLLKGGEPDLDGCAKMVINDWIRGKIPWFTPPPMPEGKEEEGVAGREGRLGEMGKKRKREEEAAAASATAQKGTDAEKAEDEEDDDEFEGFDEEAGVEIAVDEEDSDEEGADDSESDEGDAETVVADNADEDIEMEVKAITDAINEAKKRRKK